MVSVTFLTLRWLEAVESLAQGVEQLELYQVGRSLLATTLHHFESSVELWAADARRYPLSNPVRAVRLLRKETRLLVGSSIRFPRSLSKGQLHLVAILRVGRREDSSAPDKLVLLRPLTTLGQAVCYNRDNLRFSYFLRSPYYTMGKPLVFSLFFKYERPS